MDFNNVVNPLSIASQTIASDATSVTFTVLEAVTADTDVFGILSSLQAKLTESAGSNAAASYTLGLFIGSDQILEVAGSDFAGAAQTIIEKGEPKVGLTKVGQGPLTLVVTLDVVPGGAVTVDVDVIGSVSARESVAVSAQSSTLPDRAGIEDQYGPKKDNLAFKPTGF